MKNIKFWDGKKMASEKTVTSEYEIYDHEAGENRKYRKYYFPTGSFMIEIYAPSDLLVGRNFYSFKDGIEIATYEQFNKDGTLKTKTNFVEGNKHGIQERYENGKLNRMKYFWHGTELTEAEFKKKIAEIGQEISKTLNLDEKSLGQIIAEY